MLTEWILALICAQLGIVFIMKFRKQQTSRKFTQDLGVAFACFGFSLLWAFNIYADYYAPDAATRDLSILLGTKSLATCIFMFIFLIEHHDKFFIKRYFFTFIYMAGLVVSFILPFFNSGAARAFDWVLVGFFAIFFLIFLIDLSSHMKSKRNTNVTLFKFIILFILLAASYILTTDAVIAALGMGVRVIGSVLQLGVFIMIVIQFLKIPPLALLNWKRQVEDIYISDKAGICLFQKSYNPASRKLDENLVSSAISSVNSILQEMTSAKEQGLSIIKKSDRTIAIFSSELVTGAIISKEENYMINDNLKHFIQTFEVIYHRILIDWNGDSRVFQPVEAIANKIFLP